MQNINLKLFDSPEEAPNYGPPKIDAKITEMVLVANGTKEGNATVDVLFTGADGKEYVAMITANLLHMVCGALTGQATRLSEEVKH